MSYLARTPAGIAGFLGNVSKLRGMKATYNQWLATAAPTSAEVQTEQIFSTNFHSWVADEHHRVVTGDVPMSRKEFTEMLQLQRDLNIMVKPMMYTGLCGGLSLALLPEWASAKENLPANFFKTEEELKAYYLARDQEVHIKHAAQAAHTQSRYLEFYIANEARFSEAFDSVADGFTAKKDPATLKKMGQHIAKAHTCSLNHVTADVSSWQRGREHMEACNFLGLPFTFLSTEALTTRIIDHYKMLFQEDVLVQKEGVASLSDFELYEICNRRLVARWEEELSREALEARFADWCTFTSKTEADEFRVPIRLIVCYQASFFRDPGFLEETLDELNEDSFPTSWNLAQDAFERRVAFESGPLADQVRAHVLNIEASEKKATEERKAYLA